MTLRADTHPKMEIGHTFDLLAMRDVTVNPLTPEERAARDMGGTYTVVSTNARSSVAVEDTYDRDVKHVGTFKSEGEARDRIRFRNVMVHAILPRRKDRAPFVFGGLWQYLEASR